MIFKKGIKVEVLENWKLPFESWRPARILSGNGRSYVVKYDSCSLETPVVMNKVPRRALRPCPPVKARSWACGDVVEVFDDDSWKLAEVMRTLGCNMVAARLLGFSKEIKAPFCRLRMPQTWKDNHWIASHKDSVKCKKTLVNNQSKRQKVSFQILSFQIPLSSMEVQKCGRVDRSAELYDDRVDQWCEPGGSQEATPPGGLQEAIPPLEDRSGDPPLGIAREADPLWGSRRWRPVANGSRDRAEAGYR